MMNADNLAIVIAAAVKALQPTVSAAPVETVARGPPALSPLTGRPWGEVAAAPPPVARPPPPPAEPVLIGGGAGQAPDIRRTFANVMAFQSRLYWEHPLLMLHAQNLYRSNPERFSIRGIHNNKDGTRTYFSVYYTDPDCAHFNFVIHCYGILRGPLFRVTQVDIYNYDRCYEDVCGFNNLAKDDSSSERSQ